MPRPKVHGERVKLTFRLTPSQAEKIREGAKVNGSTVDDYILSAVRSFRSPNLPALTPSEPVSAGNNTPSAPVTAGRNPSPENCPHKYRVQRGPESVCASCGDCR